MSFSSWRESTARMRSRSRSSVQDSVVSRSVGQRQQSARGRSQLVLRRTQRGRPTRIHSHNGRRSGRSRIYRSRNDNERECRLPVLRDHPLARSMGPRPASTSTGCADDLGGLGSVKCVVADGAVEAARTGPSRPWLLVLTVGLALDHELPRRALQAVDSRLGEQRVGHGGQPLARVTVRGRARWPWYGVAPRRARRCRPSRGMSSGWRAKSSITSRSTPMSLSHLLARSWRRDGPPSAACAGGRPARSAR